MMSTRNIDYLVEMMQPEEGDKITDKYLIAGYFNIGNDWWCNEFNSKRDFVFVVRRLYANETVCHPWVIVEAATGKRVWDDVRGFNPDVHHPKYMEEEI